MTIAYISLNVMAKRNYPIVPSIATRIKSHLPSDRPSNSSNRLPLWQMPTSETPPSTMSGSCDATTTILHGTHTKPYADTSSPLIANN